MRPDLGICSDTTTQSEPSRVHTERVDVAVMKTDRFLEGPGEAIEFGSEGSRVKRIMHIR